MLDRILLGKLTPFFRDRKTKTLPVISRLSPPSRGRLGLHQYSVLGSKKTSNRSILVSQRWFNKIQIVSEAPGGTRKLANSICVFKDSDSSNRR